MMGKERAGLATMRCKMHRASHGFIPSERLKTSHNAARCEFSTAGSRKTKKENTVLAVGYDAMMC